MAQLAGQLLMTAAYLILIQLEPLRTVPIEGSGRVSIGSFWNQKSTA